MSNDEEVAYIALEGETVVEVAVIVTHRGKIRNIFHEFVFYANDNLEGNQAEMQPVTDSFGTRFVHGIGEMELDRVGKPLPIVQERLRLFLDIFGKNLKIIVNERHGAKHGLLQYHQMKQHRQPHEVCYIEAEDRQRKWSWEVLKQALQIPPCAGHRSTFYQSPFERTCALRTASIMVMKGRNSG